MLFLSFAFSWTSPSTFSLSFPSLLRSRLQATISILSIVSLLVTLYRWPVDPRPSKAGSRIVNAGIWTVHFGIDNSGRDSQRRMRDLIKCAISSPSDRIFSYGFRDMDLDIIGLLETDLHVSFYSILLMCKTNVLTACGVWESRSVSFRSHIMHQR